MCSEKMIKDVMHVLNLKVTIDQLAKVNSVRWYGHVLRQDNNNFLRRALDFRAKEGNGVDRRKHG